MAIAEATAELYVGGEAIPVSPGSMMYCGEAAWNQEYRERTAVVLLPQMDGVGMRKISLAGKLSQFSDHWSPKST